MNQKELSAMNPPYRYDAFISYAGEDIEFVRPLAEELTNLDLEVWFADFSLRPRDSLGASIDKWVILPGSPRLVSNLPTPAPVNE